MRVQGILFIYLLLTACGSSRESEAINKAGVFFQTFAELPYKELHTGSMYQDEISAGSDVFDFDDGKSFFLAYQLPSSHERYQVTISSYMMGDHINRASIFYPTAIVLDENYNLIRKLGTDSFVFKKIIFRETWGLPYKYEAVISFDETETELLRYLIIYTSTDQMQQRTSVEAMKVVPVVLPGAVGAVPAGKEEKLVKHSPVAKIRVELNRD